jgi:hypothetical protein
MQGCAEAGGATAVATPSCWYCRRPQVLLVVMVCSTSNCLYTLIRIPHPPSGACRSWQVKYSKRTSQLHKSATTTSCGSLVVQDLLFRTKREVARAATGECFYFNELDACSLQHQFGMGNAVAKSRRLETCKVGPPTTQIRRSLLTCKYPPLLTRHRVHGRTAVCWGYTPLT